MYIIIGIIIYLIAGYFYDSIKERVVLHNAELLYSDDIEDKGATLIGGKAYDMPWKKLPLKLKRLFIKENWDLIKPDFMGHDRGWQFYCHVFAIMALGFMVAITGNNYYWFCLSLFLVEEVGYYLWCWVHTGRWFPEDYNLGGFINENLLYTLIGAGAFLAYVLPKIFLG